MHDLGHPPFGHAGEDVLHECTKDHGGFSHNRQALRIVEIIEQRYPEFPGLNLSFEVLAGQQSRVVKRGAAQRPILEVQTVDAADSIAYDTHDVDDALQLGLLTHEELAEVPLWRQATDRVRARYQGLDDGELRRATLHELIDWQIGDMLAAAMRRLEAGNIDCLAAVCEAPLIVAFEPELTELKNELEKFLYDRVYRNPLVVASRRIAQDQLRAMFHGYCKRPEKMPESFQARIAEYGLERSVCDYLAGMTDRFCQQEFQRFFAA